MAIEAYLRDTGRWRDVFAPLVADLEAVRAAMATMLEQAQAEPMVAGSTGQPRANPAWDTFLALQDRALRLSEALGLTPATAEAAGVPLEDGEINPFDELVARRENAADWRGMYDTGEHRQVDRHAR